MMHGTDHAACPSGTSVPILRLGLSRRPLPRQQLGVFQHERSRAGFFQSTWKTRACTPATGECTARISHTAPRKLLTSSDFGEVYNYREQGYRCVRLGEGISILRESKARMISYRSWSGSPDRLASQRRRATHWLLQSPSLFVDRLWSATRCVQLNGLRDVRGVVVEPQRSTETHQPKISHAPVVHADPRPRTFLTPSRS